MPSIPAPPFTSITNELLYAILYGLPYDDSQVRMFATTEELLYAILQKGLMSGNYIGAKIYIAPTEHITVPTYHQYIVCREMTIDGSMTIDGEIIIL